MARKLSLDMALMNEDSKRLNQLTVIVSVALEKLNNPKHIADVAEAVGLTPTIAYSEDMVFVREDAERRYTGDPWWPLDGDGFYVLDWLSSRGSVELRYNACGNPQFIFIAGSDWDDEIKGNIYVVETDSVASDSLSYSHFLIVASCHIALTIKKELNEEPPW